MHKSVVGRHRLLPRIPAGNVLDELERQGKLVLALFGELASARDRVSYGVAAKLLLEHLAVREAAREELARALVSEPALAEIGRRLEASIPDRRREIAALFELERGVGPLDLNEGQDFVATITAIDPCVRGEIVRDLTELAPLLRGRMTETQLRKLPGAGHAARQALLHPDSRGPQWWERIWPLTRLRTMYDWLRRLPSIGPGGEPEDLHRKLARAERSPVDQAMATMPADAEARQRATG